MIRLRLGIVVFIMVGGIFSMHDIKNESKLDLKNLLTVKQFVGRYPVFNEGGIRNFIFWRKTNGMDKFNVIIKLGKRVLIDEIAFTSWLQSQQGIKK